MDTPFKEVHKSHNTEVRFLQISVFTLYSYDSTF